MRTLKSVIARTRPFLILVYLLQGGTCFAPWTARSLSIHTRFVSVESAPPIPVVVQESLEQHAILFLVDTENVRGKSNFKCSHESLLAKAIAAKDPSHLMVLVVDHGANGTIQVGGPLGQQVAVVFSGTAEKADDTIVNMVRSTRNTTIVVTSDNELMNRCTEAIKGRSTIDLSFIDPVKYMDQLKGLESVEELLGPPNPDESLDASRLLQKEVAVRQELQLLDRLLHPRRGNKSSGKGVSRKQRTKLIVRRDKARERLDGVLEISLRTGTPNLKAVVEGGDMEQLDAAVKGIEATSKQQIRRGTETTYERQLLSERLRRRLAEAGATTSTDYGASSVLNKLTIMVKKLADNPHQSGQRFNNPDIKMARNTMDGHELSSSVLVVSRHRSGGNPLSRPLRLVVISDTHGCENQLFQYVDYNSYGEIELSPYQLPPADILIHCGDFHGHAGSNRNGLDNFLAAQTHIPTKIVVRGNHDPRMPDSALFPRSQALFVTAPMTMELEGGIVLALRPHSRTRNDVLMPPNCDILISHEPPYGILDYTYHNQRAGSVPLRTCVESSQAKPALWLCGHIHEGRGAVQHAFSARPPRPGTTIDSTWVVNAANANSGKANRVVNGPILIDFVEKREGEDYTVSEWAASTIEGGTMLRSVAKLMRPDSLDALIAGHSNGADSSKPRRLLAVDLGLRTGAALFDQDGKIIRVDSCRFNDHDALKQGLDDLIIKSGVTDVVIEGEDRKLFNIWKKAIEQLPGNVNLARVIADDWRQDFLLKREQMNAYKAKEAASLIAKQFLVGTEYESAKLSVDAHEAILIGHYSLRVLGWTDSTMPAVQRYTNGDVFRPKK